MAIFSHFIFYKVLVYLINYLKSQLYIEYFNMLKNSVLSTLVFMFCLKSQTSQLEVISNLGFVKYQLLHFIVYFIVLFQELNNTR